MSIALLTTFGYSNGTLVGSIKDLVTMGYTISTVIPPIPATVPISNGLAGSGTTGIGLSGTQSTGIGLNRSQTTGSGLSGSGGL